MTWYQRLWRYLTHRRFGGRTDWISRSYDWLICHTLRRYHILNLSNQGDYKWGWCDRDHLMFLACFKLLADYVEREEPFEHINWESDEGHLHAAKEIRELYEWWKTGRAKEHEACEALMEGIDSTIVTGPADDGGLVEYLGLRYNVPDGEERFAAWCQRSDELEAKDSEMLTRLIAIRRYLWT